MSVASLSCWKGWFDSTLSTFSGLVCGGGGMLGNLLCSEAGTGLQMRCTSGCSVQLDYLTTDVFQVAK